MERRTTISYVGVWTFCLHYNVFCWIACTYITYNKQVSSFHSTTIVYRNPLVQREKPSATKLNRKKNTEIMPKVWIFVWKPWYVFGIYDSLDKQLCFVYLGWKVRRHCAHDTLLCPTYTQTINFRCKAFVDVMKDQRKQVAFGRFNIISQTCKTYRYYVECIYDEWSVRDEHEVERCNCTKYFTLQPKAVSITLTSPLYMQCTCFICTKKSYLTFKYNIQL